MVVEAFHELDFFTSMGGKYLLVFLADFDDGFQAIGGERGRENQDLLHPLPRTLFDDHVRRRANAECDDVVSVVTVCPIEDGCHPLKLKRLEGEGLTLFHAGTSHPQLSSCYLYYVDDSLEGIMYRGIAENAQLSKWAGGLGGSWSAVRGTGAHMNDRRIRVSRCAKLPAKTSRAVGGAICRERLLSATTVR